MKELEKILNEIEEMKYPIDGIGCGLEDVGITDRYEAAEYGWNEAVEMVSDIVKNHLSDLENDGWIPVEERLPEVPEDIDDEDCPEFNVTIKGASESTTLKCACDGTWFDDNGIVYPVVAWRPIPKPYKRDGK